MSSEYIRLCPGCQTENPATGLRCGCGALLTGVDLSLPKTLHTSLPATEKPVAPASTAQTSSQKPVTNLRCSYEDCEQDNPPGSTACLYCNRALTAQPADAGTSQIQSLLRLPAELAARYQILAPLAQQGAEAELLLIQRLQDEQCFVLKLYRHGMQISAAVQERMAQIPAAHKVVELESGRSEGHHFEVLEYCTSGSLRQMMSEGRASNQLEAIIRELATAIASVHQAGLLHRDLKPENILLRATHPLDLVLTDFGISSVMDATQKLTGAARTLYYAAPESLSGVLSAKTDFWALGMIVLEIAAGRHPFAGLSEAVILHQLTTRELDLSVIKDGYLRKLLQGLLLRDPQQRWGEAEVLRWLARDPTLPAPVETQTMAGFHTPYHIGADICHTKPQLAVALSRNWTEAAGDIANGQLLAWFRDVQKDQNAVRVLIDLRSDQQLSIDVQLLILVLFLAPGIPPVWRGESIELPDILRKANAALKGDEAAASWLHQLYIHDVLEIYANAGNAASQDIVQKWQLAAKAYVQSWRDAQTLIKENSPKYIPGEYVNIDQLMYGSTRQASPSLLKVHPQLLAISYDPKWADRLRLRLEQAYTGVQAYCPWLSALGDIAGAPASMLLVMDALLPDARAAVEKQKTAQLRQVEAADEELKTARRNLDSIISDIRAACRRNLMLGDAAAELQQALDRLFTQTIQLRAAEHISPDWMEFKKRITRTERQCQRIASLLDQLSEQRTENQGWLGRDVLVAFTLAAVILPEILERSVFFLLLFGFLGLLFWRFYPVYQHAQKIQELGSSLSSISN
jgi:serine/threonine protein kinase